MSFCCMKVNLKSCIYCISHNMFMSHFKSLWAFHTCSVRFPKCIWAFATLYVYQLIFIVDVRNLCDDTQLNPLSSILDSVFFPFYMWGNFIYRYDFWRWNVLPLTMLLQESFSLVCTSIKICTCDCRFLQRSWTHHVEFNSNKSCADEIWSFFDVWTLPSEVHGK